MTTSTSTQPPSAGRPSPSRRVAVGRGPAAPRAASTTSRRAATSTTGTIALTNGTSTSAPLSVAAHDEHVAVRQVQHVDDLAERRAADEHGGHAAQHVVVELVLVLGRRQGAGVDLQQRLAQLLGGVAVGARPRRRPPAGRSASGRRSTVSGPRSAGSVSRTAPAAKRVSGSSVRTCTVTSPLMPCGLPIRPDDEQVGLARRPDDRSLHDGACAAVADRPGPDGRDPGCRGGSRGRSRPAALAGDACHAASGPRRCRRRPRARPCRRARS